MPVPSEIIPTISHAGAVVLEYPAAAPTLSVTLPAPVVGNVFAHHVTRVLRPTRGGKLKSVMDSAWPQTDTMRVQFEGLSKELKDDFLDFLSTSFGKLVQVTDYEGRVWHGLITNPMAPATKTIRDACGWVVEFDFEGDLQ